MNFTAEQIEKAKKCKTLDELKSLAKAEGVELSDKQAEEIFSATRVGELNDDELSNVAGGSKGPETWKRESKGFSFVECPFCKARFEIDIFLLTSSKTGQIKYETQPSKCTCGAVIEYCPGDHRFAFHKNGKTIVVSEY